MSVLNPEHLLAQATRLVEPPAAGPPRQVDVRRAISAAYYAVFHAVLTAVADEIVGAAHRVNPYYAQVYRSVDHRRLRTVCDNARVGVLPPGYRPFVSDSGFGDDIRRFAGAVIDLQQRRNTADYDPTNQFTAHANQAIEIARTALRHWEAAPRTERHAFLPEAATVPGQLLAAVKAAAPRLGLC